MKVNDEEYIEIIVPEVRGSSNTAEAFSMILVDKNDRSRYLPIIIGINEARAILGEIHNKLPFRPLTHTLFVDLFSIIKEYNIEFVSIDSFNEGIYYASVVIKTPDSKYAKLDARPSDAIAIALHSYAPIYIKKSLFEEKHIKAKLRTPISEVPERFQSTIQDPISGGDSISQQLDKLPLDVLEDLLKDAIEEENYEYASEIQKAINKIRGQS